MTGFPAYVVLGSAIALSVLLPVRLFFFARRYASMGNRGMGG